ncbi:MAG: hypothetical protein KAS75_03060 [Planctomycetes bacterium]|nr:hypothetical protein [Planctomycetota bacterium]
MAGMFYSLQETAQALGVTEDQVEEFVQQGKLREFRDGPNVLFKIDEVKSLLSDTSIIAAKQIVEEVDATEADTIDETEADTIDEEEISLISEEADGGSSFGDELSDADTAMAEEGIGVLGGTGTGTDYQLTDDIMGGTSSGTGSEASLEEIEEDVNLDTFGSGSGLLDLSLQADDTSLGGILDEIYTPEGEEGQATAGNGSAVDVATEAEQMLPDEEYGIPQGASMAGAGVQAYIEPAPDMQSNAFGIMLFLPLLITFYTAIVVIASFKNVMPVILTTVQGLIWHIMAGVAVAALLIVGIACMGGGDKAAKPKVKKEKKPKKKKEKKKKKKKRKKGDIDEEELAVEEGEAEQLESEAPETEQLDMEEPTDDGFGDEGFDDEQLMPEDKTE